MRAGRRNRQRARGVPGTLRYGCHPNATGTCRRAVGTMVVSTVSDPSRAVIDSSIRWGNGNARPSTSMDVSNCARRAAHQLSIDAPTRFADEQTMDREAVVVGAQPQAAEVDVDAGGAVAARREPVAPRREQGQPCGASSAQRGEPAGQREVLATLVAEGHAGHADRGHERRLELTRAERDRGFAAEPVLLDRGGGVHVRYPSTH